MRVLLISRHIPPEIGGTEAFVESFLGLPSQCDDLEVDAVLLEPPQGRIKGRPGTRLFYTRVPGLFAMLHRFREGKHPIANVLLLGVTAAVLWLRALRLLARNNYDVIYAVGGPIAAFAGVLTKWFSRRPLATHYHYMYNFSAAGPLKRAAVRAFYMQADALIGNCDLLKRDAVKIGVPENRIYGILNWVDQRFFHPLPNRSALRYKWGIGERTAFYFGGRFDHTKHADRVIEALRGYGRKDIVIFFAGSGELRPALEQVAAENGNMRVLGPTSKQDLRELHNACDVQFWGSVDVDYPGLVIMESMSSGLPVVTSAETMNSAYAGEAVQGEVIGAPHVAQLFPPTTGGIRAAIEYAVQNRALLNALRPDVVQFANEHFGLRNADALLRILAQTSNLCR